MKTEAIKFAGWVVFGLASFATIVISVDKYFAKSSRLDSKIVDDRIFQQEQEIQNMENHRVFQRQEREYTPMEEELVEKATERLVELKEQRKKAK